MYGSQEKNLGQKVNVNFFTVDPYSVGTPISQTFLELGKFQNFFFKIKTSTIKSEKYNQIIHSNSFIFIFLGIFIILFCILPDFLKI